MSVTTIVFACESLALGNGGISRVDRLIAQVLSEEVTAGRAEVSIIVFLDCAPPPDAPENVRISSYGASKIKFAARLALEACRAHVFIYDTAYLARAHFRFVPLRVKTLVFLHGIEVWERAKRPWLAACRRADALVSNSAFTRQRADQLHGGFARAKVCWLATEHDAAGTPPAISVKRPQVLVVGRMMKQNAYKGHKELIEAWAHVLEKVPDAKLVFIGRGDLMPTLQAMAEAKRLKEFIEFKGFVTETELSEAYAQSAAFALPSRGEGFGLVYIEAMRHRLPVIASVHDAGAELVRDGETGITVNLDKPGDLADRIVGLLTDLPAAQAMGESGYKCWKENFTYEAFRTRFMAILGPLLRKSD